MIDASIYQQIGRGVKSVADYDNEYATQQQNKLAQMMNVAKMDEYQRGVQSQNALRQTLQGFGADQGANQLALMRGGHLKEAQDYGKHNADIGKTQADTDYKKLETAHKRVEMIGQGLGYLKDNPSMENAQRVIQGFVQAGIMDAQTAQEKMAAFQADPTPQGVQKLALMGYQGALSAKDQLPAYQTRNTGGTTDTLSINPVTGQVAVANSVKNTQSPDSIASIATQQRGQNMTDSRARAGQAQSASQHAATLGLQREKLTNPALKKTGPMSVTLQKELLESDDVAQASGNVVAMLETAKQKNKDAYSGYFAKGRAVLASNMPGATPGADATIDIDNMMTGQALESLKVIFGGMPTEGERKILMEMQASVDKTPKQREAIMDRGIAAAKKRGEYAKQKAKSIRSGDYLTEGMREAAADPLDSLLDKYK